MKVDLHSETWAAVRSYVEAEIAKASGRLEMPMGHDETNTERGRIRALRDVLKLGEPLDPLVRKKIEELSGGVAGY